LSFLASSGFSIPVDGIYEIPFIDRVGFVFVFCLIGMYFISLYDNKRGVVPRGLEVDTKMFKTHTGFAIGALLVLGITAALYTIFW
ncbi:MAG: sodium transporter, partial [Sphingobacterium sp.]